ncbi:diguanylate cyclase domain-containing protein [Streptomyces sp. NPDC055134]
MRVKDASRRPAGRGRYRHPKNRGRRPLRGSRLGPVGPEPFSAGRANARPRRPPRIGESSGPGSNTGRDPRCCQRACRGPVARRIRCASRSPWPWYSPPSTALAEICSLREHLQQPLQHEQLTLRLDVSLGIARAVDLPGETCSRILRGADNAMYKVKAGRVTFPYLATRADAYAATVNGRRSGRHGTHLLAHAA